MIVKYTSVSRFLIQRVMCFSLCLFVSFAGHTKLVVTMPSDKSSIVSEALTAIHTNLARISPEATIVPIEEVTEQSPNLVITLGNKALSKAQERFVDAPILACLIQQRELPQSNPKISSITLERSIKNQLYWYNAILPKAKNMAIIYSPKHNQNQVELIKKATKNSGINVIAIPINSVHELPSALKAVRRNADSILALPDPMVYSGKTAKGVLLFTFRNKIPLIGLSKAWVKAGALYALDWDYHKLGQQCAKQAGKILLNKNIDKFTTTSAEQSHYFINQRTANAMNLTLDKSIINGANFVFK